MTSAAACGRSSGPIGARSRRARKGGWAVTEVWEAQENWDSWFEGTIKPNLPDGLEPRITTRELNNVMQP